MLKSIKLNRFLRDFGKILESKLNIDFKFLNGKIHRFFIEKKEITFNELLDTIIKDNQYLFKNIKTSFYLDSNF